MSILLLGAGNSREKRIAAPVKPDATWLKPLITLDIDETSKPDVVHDLHYGIPFNDNTFQEIHAYEVLEHYGTQGDYRAFFHDFEEIWRVLKPDGYLCASCPRWDSPLAWGDPGHRRIISEYSLAFLSREEYQRQVGVTCMSDYRSVYHADFRLIWQNVNEGQFFFVLQALK